MLSCLVACVAPLALHAAAPAVLPHVLAGGLVLSRFGLWLFDLSVGQMLQERVPGLEMGACRAGTCLMQDGGCR